MEIRAIDQLPPPLIPVAAVFTADVPEYVAASSHASAKGADEDGRLLLRSPLPVLVAGGMVVDGIRRLEWARRIGRTELPVAEITTDPWTARLCANFSRRWNLVETALVIEHLGEEDTHSLLNGQGHAGSPPLRHALRFIASHPHLWPVILGKSLPAAIFRDMAYLGALMEPFLIGLLQHPGTVGEKRAVAGLFKQCAIRRLVLDQPFSSLEAARTHLLKLLEPRRTEAMDRWRQALTTAGLPAGVEVKIDPVLEKPGITVSAHICRDRTDDLQRIALSLNKLFAEVPEL